MNNEDLLLNVNEVAKILGAKPSTIYKWVHKKMIVFVKIGNLVRFKKSDILKMIENNTIKAGF